MKKISWVTHPQYDIPLPRNHKFTSSKFSDLFKELNRIGLIDFANILIPKKASTKDLTLVHEEKYIKKILDGSLEASEERRLGLKWSPELSNRSFLAVNGTLLTAKTAIEDGIACHIAVLAVNNVPSTARNDLLESSGDHLRPSLLSSDASKLPSRIFLIYFSS
jgi:acetoin utilization deacetylase AcuC-like enzyme